MTEDCFLCPKQQQIKEPTELNGQSSEVHSERLVPRGGLRLIVQTRLQPWIIFNEKFLLPLSYYRPGRDVARAPSGVTGKAHGSSITVP